MPSDYPARIVCLSAEAVEILYRLGCGERVVGVTGFAMRPEARQKPRVSGFSTVNYKKIDALKPDLVITFSDVQAEATRELIRRGHVVLATNQRSLADVFQTILLIGRVVGREKRAKDLVNEVRTAIRAESTHRGAVACPKVYFEEWDEPFISGIRWVSELIEAAGGEDIFPEMRERSRALDRVVSSDEIIRREPEVIVASWCGRKANLATISKRPGWNVLPAVSYGRVHEIKSEHILQPGPSLIEGFQQLRAIIAKAQMDSPILKRP